MRSSILLAALTAALALPAAAAAKGPDLATITGPGLVRAVIVRGDGEGGNGTALGDLVTYGGWFPTVFGADGATSARRPAGDLGPSYRVVYRMPGPAAKPDRIVATLYPYARPAPLIYMQPKQRFWVTMRTHGGWFRADPRLRATLVRAGLPASAPHSGGGFPWTAAAIAGGVVLALLLAVRTMRAWTARSTSSTAEPSA